MGDCLHHRVWRGIRRSGAGAAIALAIAGVPASAQNTVPETRLKAAIVSKIAQFVEWPPAALAGRDHLEVCIVTPDPFGSDITELVSGENLNGRPLTSRLIERDPDVPGCQVLYVASATFAAKPSILQTASRLPILTVSDAPGFLDAGGIVLLRQVRGKLRFDINLATAQRVGLRLSSQLLQLAIDVRGAHQ